MAMQLARNACRGLLVILAAFGTGPQAVAAQSKKPNVVYFLVDNLGMGELSSYSGGNLRGITTTRIDNFGREGMMLLNFAPETQCTPVAICLDDRTVLHPLR
jgi:hypothetical protein